MFRWLYAPAPADLAADYARRYRNSGGRPGEETWPFTPEQNRDAYERISPINYLDAVSAPVQLHHGTADTTVASSASTQITEALQTRGKSVELFLYKGSGHAFKNTAYNRYEERTLTFFRQQSGGGVILPARCALAHLLLH